MEKTIQLPEDVKARMEGKTLVLTGPLGELKKGFSHMRLVDLETKDSQVTAKSSKKGKRGKMMVNTAEAHINNMVMGVTKGFRVTMSIVNVHFPTRVSVSGDEITISNFLGGKSDIKIKKYPDVEVKPHKDKVVLEGMDLEHVTQTAARIEQSTKKKLRGKDRRVFKDGIYPSERGHIHE